VPPVIAIARFIRQFGHATYQNPQYATRDHVIPFGLFWILHAAMTHTMALDRVNETRAIVHALANTFGDGKGAGAELTRAELAEAFLETR
jgi:hypothetical protein